MYVSGSKVIDCPEATEAIAATSSMLMFMGFI